MPAPEAFTVDPTKELASKFKDRVLPEFSNAIGTQLKPTSVPDSVIGIKKDGTHTYNYQTESSDKVLVGTINDIDFLQDEENGHGRVKVRSLMSSIGFVVSDFSWQNFLKGKTNYRVEFGKTSFYYYDAGKLAEDEGGEFKPVVSTKVTVKDQPSNDGHDNEAVLDWFEHDAHLLNPDNPMDLRLSAMGKSIGGNFEFNLWLTAGASVEGERVASSYAKQFKAVQKGDQIEYVGNAVYAVSAEILKPFMNVAMSEKEIKMSQEQHALMARIARYMPSSFTEEQVRAMVQNALDGKVMTAGIWDPLTLPYAREESRKTHSSDERSEMRRTTELKKVKLEMAAKA